MKRLEGHPTAAHPFRRFGTRARLAIVLAGIAPILALSAGLVSATIPSAGGVIHACYKAADAVKDGGAVLQIIDGDSVATCRDNEVKLTFKDAASLNALVATLGAADTTLQTNINAEAAARMGADSTLQTNINAEAAARAAADTTVQGLINNLVAFLASPGTVNSSDNPVHWTRLKGVPGGFADGVDNDTTYSGSNFATSNQDCPGSQFAKGIDASGGLECGSPARGTLSTSQVAGPEVLLCAHPDPTCSSGATSTATCPAGTVVTGGGFDFYPDDDVVVEESRRSFGGDGWSVHAENYNIITGGHIQAFATCLRLN